MTSQMPLPYNVLVASAAEAVVARLVQTMNDERLRITACTTEEEARGSLTAGLPDVGVLDGSLAGASLLRIYSALRPERGSDPVPVLFTSHDLGSPPVLDGIPDRYLPATVDLDTIEREIYQALGIPLPERHANQPDPMARDLLAGLRGGGFEAATYLTADSALRELDSGLPAAAVLDASLPEDELVAVYESIRERPGGADLPVIFIHDPRCPAGEVLISGADIYVGDGASIDQALNLLRERVATTSATVTHREGGEPPARRRFGPLPSPRNPFAQRVLRALPIAAMVVIGGLAGVMTVRMFDTRSWPLAHPTEVSAATPGAATAVTRESISEGSSLHGLATRAAGTSAAAPPARPAGASTPEPVGCALLPAFETMREAIGAEMTGPCTDQPSVNEAGDAEQPTTRGLFAYKRDLGYVAFTDGFRTWMNGPLGLQQRLNSERFAWETAFVQGDPWEFAWQDNLPPSIS